MLAPLLYLLPLLLLGSCAATPGRDWARTRWQAMHERPGTSLRGLSVPDARTIWASGSGGTIVRSIDGGETFTDVAPEHSSECDFRDVHAFDRDTAVAMVAGQPARVYRTTNGGRSWQVVVEDHDERAFFDSIDFDGDRGVLFGDPRDGAFYVLASADGGVTWQRATKLPEPIDQEAGFAASGTCVSIHGRTVRIATGGGAARCLLSSDGGAVWESSTVPVLQGAASQGTFGIAFRGNRGVAVGGDYLVPDRTDGTAAWTKDGGRIWYRSAAGAGGYRSAVAWLDDECVLAVGEKGSSLSLDGGSTWQPFDAVGFHAVTKSSDGRVIACGSDGRIAVLEARAPRPFATVSLFGDHMVMPANANVTVRGYGEPGALVEIRASWRARASGTVNSDGLWRCELPTSKHGGPHTVVLTSGAAEVILHDVLLGDVWLCSGQSNMEMPLGNKGGWQGGVDNWQQEVAAANHPMLRVFTVTKATSGVPLRDVVGEWQLCTPAAAAGFSATAYFFGRELVQRERGPIGLVVSSWGGTVCEAWTSPTALTAFPEFGKALALAQQPESTEVQQRNKFWRAVSEVPGTGGWHDVTLPGVWSHDGLADFDGVAFYRRQLEVPVALRGQALTLELGAIDDMDTVWCNGERVGGMEQTGAFATERRYTIPAAVIAGRDQLVVLVRVVDTGGEGGFSSAPEVMQLRGSGGTGGSGEPLIALAGAWQRQTGAKLADLPPWPATGNGSPNRPAVLWNGMIEPLLPFPFSGVIWYQGESNRGRAEQYSRLFPAMIRDWRRAIGASSVAVVPGTELPFHFVQIAPFGYPGGAANSAAELREAQAAALALPGTGMAVTLDIGDSKDIHPRNKQDVGRRLALQALRHPYGSSVIPDGPVPAAVTRDAGGLRITFQNVERGLTADQPVAGFEVADHEGVFVAATARIDGDAVVVMAPSVEAPSQVRYAWAAVPDGTLRNGLGLPAAPFRSGLTAPQR